MAKTLTNGTISIAVKDHGAELCSISKNGREYLWGAYPEFWKRHSPILFPIVGSVWDGEYRSGGNTYKMGQHGFARDMDFVLVVDEKDYVEYELKSSEETIAKYPYEFVLHIGYRIHEDTVDVIWKVTNTGDKEMSFQIGAHPAFYWPLLSDEVVNGGVGEMNKVLSETADRGFFLFADGVQSLERVLITEAGCVDPDCKETVVLEDGYLKLNGEVFAKDALIMENNQIQEVTLCDAEKKPYLTLRWDAPLVGLWSPPGKNAPFVCIEPWYGRADRVRYSGTYEEKEHNNRLAPKETFDVRYSVILR